MIAAPSKKDFFTYATTAVFVLKWSRDSSSTGFLPLATSRKKSFDPARCNSCSAKVRCAGVGLKSYLSSGKSSAITITLRPISFHDCKTASDFLSGVFDGEDVAAVCASTTDTTRQNVSTADRPALVGNALFIGTTLNAIANLQWLRRKPPRFDST